MTQKEVKKLNKAELIEFAVSEGIEVSEEMSKAQIYDLVIKSGKLDEPSYGQIAEASEESLSEESSSEQVSEITEESLSEGLEEAPSGQASKISESSSESPSTIAKAISLELSKRQSKVKIGFSSTKSNSEAVVSEIARRATLYGGESMYTNPSPEEMSSALHQELARRAAKNK